MCSAPSSGLKIREPPHLRAFMSCSVNRILVTAGEGSSLSLASSKSCEQTAAVTRGQTYCAVVSSLSPRWRQATAGMQS